MTMGKFYSHEDMLRDLTRVYSVESVDIRVCLFELLKCYNENEFPEYFQDEAYEIFKRYHLIN